MRVRRRLGYFLLYFSPPSLEVTLLTPWFGLSWAVHSPSQTRWVLEDGLWLAIDCENWATRTLGEAIGYRRVLADTRTYTVPFEREF